MQEASSFVGFCSGERKISESVTCVCVCVCVRLAAFTSGAISYQFGVSLHAMDARSAVHYIILLFRSYPLVLILILLSVSKEERILVGCGDITMDTTVPCFVDLYGTSKKPLERRKFRNL